MSKIMQGYRGSLDLYYQVEDDSGDFGDEIFDAGNVTDFSITPNAEEMEIIDTGNANYGQAADSMIDAQPTNFSFAVNRFNIDNWAVAFMGTYAARTAVQATVTAEVITAPPKGGMFRLAGKDISAITVTDNAGTTTYDVTDDYVVVDAALGILRTTATGDITAATTIKVTYTKAAETGFLLSGGTKTSRFLRIFGRGVNRFNNKRCIVEIFRGSVRAGGAFSFVGTEAASMQFDGTANVPTDGGAVFTVITEV